MAASKKTKRSAKSVILYCLFGLIFALSGAVMSVCIWYKTTFALPFKTLLYVLSSPLQGTGATTIREVIAATVPAAVAAALVYTVCLLLINRRTRDALRRGRLIKRLGAILCCFCLVASLLFAVHALGIPRYIELTRGDTGFYEAYYQNPENVTVTADGETKNLIYIYLESMESTYASVEDGGKQTENYIPYMTALASDNISFTDKEDGRLGGFVTLPGTGWTVAALLATSSGIPFSFPLGENGNNAMSKQEFFASGLTTIGDILEKNGYRQMFLCGSDAGFGGRDKYYIQHGNFEIYDLDSARADGVVAKDYHNGFWGIEDYILFDIAKTQLTKLAAEEGPFNLTMLTVDGHHNGGYLCRLCGNDYEELSEKYRQTANVVTCQDRLVNEFIRWCSEQDWYEDTVIIISGDHPRMDPRLVSKIPYRERTVYNCFINAVPSPAEGVGENGRVWSPFDMFPTTLAAMGFDVIGERLGLGTNLFSSIPTLAEEIGMDMLEAEIQKQSEYYVNTFSPELVKQTETAS